ncbi:MAG: D-2-hydroxyacid dehydrogenase [Acidimicrobiales bacterium]
MPTPSAPLPVCLVGPDMMFSPAAVARFVAANPHLHVHWVDYTEPNELRVARATGTAGAEDLALQPDLAPADREALGTAVALIALDLPTEIAQLAPHLRFVQAVGAGIEWLVAHRLDEQGVTLTRASGVASGSIAEFVMARVLEVAKHLRALEANQRQRVWERHHGRSLAGQTFGVVGLGAIGRDSARLARAFGMTVEACRRSTKAGDVDPDVDRLWPLDALDELLGRCDVVLCSAPATAATQHLFDAGRFAAMRPGATFVNVARGSLVQEADLVAALRSGHLGAAIVDVAAQEPAPPDHPFWDTPNLYLSPHCSASFEGYSERLFDLFLENLDRLNRGAELLNVVDAGRGY